jgi:hypothetical protein
MGQITNGHAYRFAAGIVARADLAGNSWWQLTEIVGIPARAHAATNGRTLRFPPTKALDAGPIITTDGSTTVGSALPCHPYGQTQVIRAGSDAGAPPCACRRRLPTPERFPGTIAPEDAIRSTLRPGMQRRTSHVHQ